MIRRKYILANDKKWKWEGRVGGPALDLHLIPPLNSDTPQRRYQVF